MAAMTPTIWLASAGFVATAISFGPARMGFGLFLPTLREAFDLDTKQAGFIASLGFLAFLIALPVTAWLGRQVGQRMPVVLGAVSASLGFAVVASAQNSAGLGVGITLAGASAGFCWAPFNDAAERVVSPAMRPSSLSTIATGTTIGVAATGALYLGVNFDAFDWRLIWGAFAAFGLAGAILAMRGVPGGRVAECSQTTDTRGFVRRDVAPLYGAALCFGISNAVYLAFAADHVVASGGLDGLPDKAAAAMIFLSYGICGLAGLATGRFEAWLGLVALLGIIFAAFASSLVLVALVPRAWGAVLVSAGLHGAAVMMVSAILSFWSLRLFPGRGSLGFIAALIGVAIGSAVGPAVLGVVAEATSVAAALLLTATIPLIASLGFAIWAIRYL